MSHKSEIDVAVSSVLGSGNYILGPQVEMFEAAFASYCGVSHAVGVNSGTDALSLVLRALDISHGDRVVTVSHTALATVAAIVAVGASPVLVDIEPGTYGMDASELEAVMTGSVKAIVVVHLYGAPADLHRVCQVANEWGVPVIEDCAQATGARYGEKRVGSVGKAGCFSFYPTKNLGAIGDGGMVVTDDSELATRLRRARQYGWTDARVAERPGVNSRLDEMQAAILLAKLPSLDRDVARRGEIAHRYTDAFRGLPVVAPRSLSDSVHAYHLYVISTMGRDRIQRLLSSRGVQTAIHYAVPVHHQLGYEGRVEVPRPLRETEQAARRVLTLPLYPELTDLEIDTVIAAVCGSYRELAGGES